MFQPFVSLKMFVIFYVILGNMKKIFCSFFFIFIFPIQCEKLFDNQCYQIKVLGQSLVKENNKLTFDM